MPFNVSSFIEDMSENILSSSFSLTVAKNPIYTALANTSMILIILLLVFSHSSSSLMTLVIRAGFWIFLINCIMIMLHNKILMKDMEKNSMFGKYDDIIANGAADDVEYVPVRINTNFSAE